MSDLRIRIAIIGAGPSGFYTAEGLLKEIPNVSIDLIDRLPTPYGLVRYGVAPDHQKIKSVTKMYERTASDSRFRFLGNVTFGKDLSYSDIKKHYHAVVYTVGASADRNLGIAGEALEGSMSATEFVAWYNGHPDYANHIQNLTAKQVAVVGMGNVAIDVTRILAKSVDDLKTTDIADHALEVLKESPVTDIYMLGRRGPAQAKFTTKELRELGELPIADIIVNAKELELDQASLASIDGDPAMKKNIEILQEFAHKKLEGKPRRVHLRFFISPIEIMGQQAVEALKLEHNRLDENLGAIGTGQFETLPMQMVLRSVGYKGVALPEISFDTRKGIIPNIQGRVTDNHGQVINGEYVAGWIKRGPSGVIGTNKADAMETVQSLKADLETLTKQEIKADTIDQLLNSRGVQSIGFNEWLKLDAYETQQGSTQGRPRVKVTSIQKMLELCKNDS